MGGHGGNGNAITIIRTLTRTLICCHLFKHIHIENLNTRAEFRNSVLKGIVTIADKDVRVNKLFEGIKICSRLLFNLLSTSLGIFLTARYAIPTEEFHTVRQLTGCCPVITNINRHAHATASVHSGRRELHVVIGLNVPKTIGLDVQIVGAKIRRQFCNWLTVYISQRKRILGDCCIHCGVNNYCIRQ